MSLNDELVRRAEEYARRNRLVVGRQLGFGIHGIVFSIGSQPETDKSAGRSAIKVHRREPDYLRERDVYMRLRDVEVTTVRQCHIPRLLSHDDDLWVIEMTVVTRPFVLDFAGADLDRPPDFSEEVLADWRADKEEEFGPRWPEVQAILRAIEHYGIFMLDVNPGNVSFPD